MSVSRPWAEVWPTAAAREEAVSAGVRSAPGGFWPAPPCHAQDAFLAGLLAEAPLPSGRERLLPLAGPLLVQALLRDEAGEGGTERLFQGLATTNRPPDRLWRLLVEIKAAGLAPATLLAAAHASPRLAALGRLLAAYQAALEQRGLADPADDLARLEALLAQGRLPPSLAGLAGVRVREVLWLRALDLRLLRALARVLPVKVAFALAEPGNLPSGVFRLLRNTASLLEGEEGSLLEVAWGEPLAAPLAGALGGLLPELAAGGAAMPRLRLLRPAGRYAEVEALVETALDLLEAGTPPHEIVLAFPGLELYGQMTEDAAARRGLPLARPAPPPLDSLPLVQTFLSLLELPLAHYARPDLAAALASPYLEAFRGSGLNWGEVLNRAGYLDGRETPPDQQLVKAAQRKGGRAGAWAAVIPVLQKIKVKLDLFSQQINLSDYIMAAWALAEGLTPPFPGTHSGERPPWRGQVTPEPAAVWARDLAARTGLDRVLAGLAAAAQQAPAERLPPARHLAALRQALAGAQVPGGRRPLAGVRLLRLADCQGLYPRHLLVGGLVQGEFPQRPGGRQLLPSQDRRELGHLARLVVWRTDEEEYGGQLLGLARLIGAAGQSATLSAPAAGADGGELEPSAIFRNIASVLGQACRPAPPGRPHGLAGLREPQGLTAALAAGLWRPARPGDPDPLAQAALWRLCRDPADRAWWAGVAARGALERRRRELDFVAPGERAAASFPGDGRLQSHEALLLLGAILADPRRRSLSASSLEQYGACPMAWFWSYLMGLREDPPPAWGLTGRDEGEWVHLALRHFFAPEEFVAWTPAQRRERLAACLDRAGEDLAAAGQGGHPLAWQSRRAPLLAALERVVASECTSLGEARPRLVEADFGGSAGTGLAVPLRGGGELWLRGRLDRLDQGPGIVQVSDYKHSRDLAGLANLANPANQGHTVFQLPVYLAAASAFFIKEYDKSVKIARLVSTQLPTRPAWLLRWEPGDPFLASDAATRQVLRREGGANLFNAIEDLWLRLTGGDFTPRPVAATCRRCEYRGLCRARVETAGEGGAE